MKKKKRGRSTRKKEEIADDWCFVCKDGGKLRVCDYKQCLKSYHPDCVGKDDAFLESQIQWSCNLHACFICGRTPLFSCYCCPKAICYQCIDNSEFVNVRGKKGFCSFCLKIALLVEEKKDVNSDGEKVDFKDQATLEYLFMEFWLMINKKEGLTVENLQSAQARLNTGNNYKSDADFDESYTSQEDQPISDSDIMNHKKEQKQKRKKCIGQPFPGTKMSNINRKEFTGWGSKSLVQFLLSIGKDPSVKLSQHDVTNIINGYIKENNLFHPQKKKQVICDERLQSVLGRKVVSKHRIFDLLEIHFADNLDSSDSGEDDCPFSNSDKMGGDILLPCKKQRKPNVVEVPSSHKKNFVSNVPQNCLASVVPENIKLIYLRRSLVKELLKQPETFESKVVESFVRIKSDPNDIFQTNPYQLVQVTGIKKTSVGENNTEIFLQVSAVPKDIPISVLSDNDFSEEECEDLRCQIERGLVKKLTVNELERKARVLHEYQMKHWIDRELISLQKLIDRANEKGWRREMYEHMERKQRLNSIDEQSRLLKEIPTVIPCIDKHDGDEEGSPNSILVGTSETNCANWGCGGTFSDEEKHQTQISFLEEKQNLTKKSALIESPQEPPILSPKFHLDVEETQKCRKTLIPTTKDHSNDTLETVVNHKSSSSGTKQVEPADIKSGMEKSCYKFIDLTRDDPDDEQVGNSETHATIGIHKLEQVGNNETHATIGIHKIEEDPESPVWHCLGPNGERKGPHSLSLLKKWSEFSSFALEFKVWKINQSEENAISLRDVVDQISCKKI